MVGVVFDFTERRQVEEQLRGLSGRLITAQEEERKRLARELHDDLAQRVALLGLSVSKTQRKLNESHAIITPLLTELHGGLLSVSDLIRQISHELHPTLLEQLGLTTAIASFCIEFGERYEMDIGFAADGGKDPVPAAVGLCMYRITQESLRNIAKHSGSKHVRVKLTRTPDAMELLVSDNGIGFDPLIQRDWPGLDS
jgi:signal transduction histidine kinase